MVANATEWRALVTFFKDTIHLRHKSSSRSRGVKKSLFTWKELEANR